MNKAQVLNSSLLKKRFCKLYGIPISVYDEPYFSERLKLYDFLYCTISKFESFCEDMSRFNGEQNYFSLENDVRNKAIKYIQENPHFNGFNHSRSLLMIPDYPSQNLYVEPNDGCEFISIDMKQANFSALHFYDPKIFNGADSWQEFIGGFTDLKCIVESKYLRQVILGACNPNRQIKYEKFLMGRLLERITYKMPQLQIYSFCNDEIIIKLNDAFAAKSALEEVIDAKNSLAIGELARCDMFLLTKLNNINGYMKTSYTKDPMEPDFKCVDRDLLPQIVRYFYDENITRDDLVFYHDGKLARFVEPIQNPFRGGG